eukprot:COSAG01_NODE_27771_length_677_cov_1.148789_1_plen_104_part_01
MLSRAQEPRRARHGRDDGPLPQGRARLPPHPHVHRGVVVHAGPPPAAGVSSDRARQQGTAPLRHTNLEACVILGVRAAGRDGDGLHRSGRRLPLHGVRSALNPP